MRSRVDTIWMAKKRVKRGVSILDARVDGGEIVSRVVGTLCGFSDRFSQQGSRLDGVRGKQRGTLQLST